MASSSRTNDVTPDCRSAGTFASAFATAASTPSGTVSRIARSRVGRSVISFAITACAVAAGDRRLAGQHLVQHAASE